MPQEAIVEVGSNQEEANADCKQESLATSIGARYGP